MNRSCDNSKNIQFALPSGTVLGRSLAGLALLGLCSVLAVNEARAQNEAVLHLTLREAVALAQAPGGNVRLELAERLIQQAEARADQTRAALLPHLEAMAVEQNQTRNLAAFGIRIQVPIPGFQFPEVVGPFTTFDARASVSQTVLDLSAFRRFQASSTGVQAASVEKEHTSEQVAGDVARGFTVALMAQARVEIAQANLKLAEVLLGVAENQKSAGTGTGVEVTRARVQLANERQRLMVAENERRASVMRLLRLVGLSLDRPVQLDPADVLSAPASTTVENALVAALESRSDLKAQAKRAESARQMYSAVQWERLPSLVAFGDYGSIGWGMDSTIPTRTYGLSMRIPVFDGGRRDARRAENRAQVELEEIRLNDLRRQIELEVRVAFDNMKSAEEQMTVSREGLELAQAELAQARRRYEAGVTSSIELTDAQTRLARAQENELVARFSYQLARIELASATGTVQKLIQ